MPEGFANMKEQRKGYVLLILIKKKFPVTETFADIRKYHSSTIIKFMKREFAQKLNTKS
jgi:hypothetical protein